MDQPLTKIESPALSWCKTQQESEYLLIKCNTCWHNDGAKGEDTGRLVDLSAMFVNNKTDFQLNILLEGQPMYELKTSIIC